MKKVLTIALSFVILITCLSSVLVTQAATMPSCTDLKASEITQTSARIDFNIKNPSGLKVPTCGMQIRKKGNSSWTTKTETMGSSYQTSKTISVWYTVGSGKELNYTLSSGTTYEYRGLCKYNGNTYYSSISTFTTKSNAVMPSCTDLKASEITQTSARIDFNIKNPSGLKVPTCGMQIRKKGNSSWTTKTETMGSSYQTSKTISVWYTVGSGKELNYTLSSGTTYEYRGLCKYNGNTYYSSISTFTTKSKSTSSEADFSTKVSNLKKKYPEGTSWTSSKKAYGGTGCYAFAATCYNYVNGHQPGKIEKNISKEKAFNSIKVGDMVHYYYYTKDANGKKIKGQHWVYVIAKNSSSITVGEGNYGDKNPHVHWGRKINKSKFDNGEFFSVETRRG